MPSKPTKTLHPLTPYAQTVISILFLSILTVFASCTGKGTSVQVDHNHPLPNTDSTLGNPVSELDPAIFIIYQDQDNHYWFGSDGHGVYRYDGDTLLHYSTKDGLSHDRIRGIQEDQAGNIFISTLGGISKFDGKRFVSLPLATSQEWKLEPGDLWFKSEPGKNGPYRFDGDSLYSLAFPKHDMEDLFYAQHPNPPYSPYEVYTHYQDQENNIWFGTSNFGLCRYNGESLSWMYEEHLTTIEATGGSFGIRSIVEDHKGHFWFCNSQYRYTIYPTEKEAGQIDYRRAPGIENISTPDGKDLIYFMAAVTDDDGDLWMVTYNSGVWRYDGKEVVHFPIETTLYSIYKDNQGTLWLGSHQAGAYRFNGTAFEPFIP